MQQLKQLQSYAAENPNRTQSLTPIEIRQLSDTQEGQDAPATIAGGLCPTPLEPPGPLSMLLWLTDAEFRGATAQVRRNILREQIIAVQTRVDAELRGIRWSRKKTTEQLAAQQTSAVSPPMQTPELDAALAHLFGYQKLLIDEAGRRVEFIPADPRTWSAEFPIWAATTGSRAVVHRAGEEPVGPGLGQWLSDREREGWKISWPTAEGTMEELKTKLSQIGIGAGVGAMAGKPKKADYAAAVGKAEAIRHISSLSATS